MTNLTKKPTKKVIIVLIICSLLVIGIICSAIFINKHLNEIDTSTIQINVSNEDNTIERVYETSLDLSGITISYKNNKHEEKTITANEAMVLGYDPECMGKQEIIIQYYGVTKSIFVNTMPSGIATPTLGCGDNKLTWTVVNNSKGYQIKYGTSPDLLTYLCNVATNSYDLSSFKKYGQYYFSVKAIKGSEKYYDSEWSNILDIYNLEKVCNVEYSNKTLIWDQVDGANSYAVEINGKKINGITETNYKCDFGSGNYKVKVYAYPDAQKLVYSESDEVNYTVLNSISNVHYSDNCISWNEVNNADSYVVYVNDNYFIKAENAELDVTAFESGIFDFKIIANSDNSTIIESPEYSFEALINYELNINNKVVSWNQLDGEGISYYVVIDDNKESAPDLDFQIDLASINLEAGSHTVKIKVLSSKEMLFDTSKELTIYKVNKPILAVSDGKVIGSGEKNNLKLFKNKVDFSGDIALITEVGNHSIVGKYIAANDSQLQLLMQYPH